MNQKTAIILGDRDKKRIGESLGAVLMKSISILLNERVKKYRAIEADCIADAMIKLAESLLKMQIVNTDLLQKLGNKKRNIFRQRLVYNDKTL